MRIGISSACLYPELTENSVEILGSSGIKNIEIFINSASELENSFVDRLCRIKNEYSMNVLSIHPYTSVHEPFMIFTDYERRYYDALESYKKYFEAMNKLGANFLVFHGDRKESPFSNEKYFERFLGLKRLAEQYGVTVAQENVARCKSSKIDFIKEMKKAIPDVSFVLDVKQTVRSNVDTFELLDIMGDNLKHIHLSDNNEECDCLPVGKGNFDVMKLFTRLKQMKYNGGVLLELYRDDYDGLDDLLNSHRNTLDIYNNCLEQPILPMF